jgi:hypothetical protein
MKKLIYMGCMLSLFVLPNRLVCDDSYISKTIRGRLGNQMFQVAAALSLAWDNDVQAIFPELSIDNEEWDFALNRRLFFSTLNFDEPCSPTEYVFREHRHFVYRPIRYRKNMLLDGYFQSEKYFKKYQKMICDLFQPSPDILNYLKENYQSIIDHPNTVGIHLRGYEIESKNLSKCFPFLKENFFLRAAELFPSDALFVIFTDRPKWAMQILKNFERPHIFIENETYYHDFYLLSFCKHQILSSSSFGWWAAYLNKNKEKKVVAPDPWFSKISRHDSSNVIPDNWIKLSY